ncbi:NAD-dependent protein deacetylase [Penicillium ucsense]|uniref:NAD-dependent protein deacetylase n=1 Tax=Penicillium ucsense TaxID=2839758 RepID=A0A8J8W7D1_9EURO|nr:NAD-dependent protein deacetylase [Penicillium ucsense]KAF7738053.1 NAD-dependent protein deacetylase [Penicillium ucsense]
MVTSTDIQSFSEYLKGCRRILALLGAGASAASGLPTFRGAGGLWRQYDATALATPEAFEMNPGLVWQFYSHRRHMALQALPNKAHYALAELARRNQDFITLSQNVDGLSQRAQHPSDQLNLLHGSLFDIKCTSFYCHYTRSNDFSDPIVPALELPQHSSFPQTHTVVDKVSDRIGTSVDASEEEGPSRRYIDISDESVPIPKIVPEDLPRCPECKGLLRPGVVWFGESLPTETLKRVDDWIEDAPVDLILVIGTSARVYPAAGYVDVARDHGAKVAVVNMEQDMSSRGKRECDWFFQGDASVIVPEILKSVIGDL